MGRKDAREVVEGVRSGATQEVVRVLEWEGGMTEEIEGAGQGGGDFVEGPVSCMGGVEREDAAKGWKAIENQLEVTRLAGFDEGCWWRRGVRP